MKKIAVVGRGWVGKKIAQELRNRQHEVYVLSHDQAMEAGRLSRYGLEWVINCAGVTGTPNVDACELNKENTIEGNAIYPTLLHDRCDRLGIRYAHFSSGCIYSGEIDSPDAEGNFVGSTYSLSKLVSDTYLKSRALVFRIRMPFVGVDDPKNLLTKLYKYAKVSKLVDLGQNSLTDLDEAISVAVDLIEANVPNGPYNLVNPGSVDMHELTELMGITPEFYSKDEFFSHVKTGRSTCVIPCNVVMTDVRTALKKAILNMSRGE